MNIKEMNVLRQYVRHCCYSIVYDNRFQRTGDLYERTYIANRNSSLTCKFQLCINVYLPVATVQTWFSPITFELFHLQQ